MGKEYNVVFEQANGFYTWTSYENKEQFKQLGHFRGEAVAKRVSKKRAIEICEEHNKPTLEAMASICI